MNYLTQPIADALLDLQHIDTASGADDPGNNRAMESITSRLQQLQAFSGTFNDETDELTLDVTPLLVAIATSQMFLIQQLAEARGISQDAVRFEVRQYLETIADHD